MKSGQNTEDESILLFEAGTILFVRIKDETESIGPKQFKSVELSANLKLNYSKRKHAFLENCACYIPELKQDSKSLNHAYTIISTHFEAGRLSKGGNVFNKVFFASYSGDLLPLATARTNALSKIQLKASKPEVSVSSFDIAEIEHFLKDVLYDETLFADLIETAIIKCEQATRNTSYGTNHAPGPLFPLYFYIFGQFRASLTFWDLSGLMERWSGQIRPFIYGSWSGFFNSEIAWLIANDSEFTAALMAFAKSHGPTGSVELIEEWMSRRLNSASIME